MALTLSALFVGAVFGVAVGCLGLAIAGLLYVKGMDAIGRSETGRHGGRLEAGRKGCAGRCPRPAEPDRVAVLRVYRETGWIDINTARRITR